MAEPKPSNADSPSGEKDVARRATPSKPSQSDVKDPSRVGNPAKRAQLEEERTQRRKVAREADVLEPVPTWYKVIMFGLMILGLLWIVTFYIAAMVGVGLPIPGIGNWNIAIGFVLAMVGFIMMMRWRD